MVAEREPDPDHVRYLRALGIGPEQTVVPSGSSSTSLVDRLRADTRWMRELEGRGVLEPYFAGPRERALARELGIPMHGSTSDIAERVNHKAALGELLERARLPRIETRTVERDRALEVARAALDEGPVIVRADVGIAGLGVFLVHDAKDLATLDDQLAPYAPSDLFLVQRFLTTVSSPNIQFDLFDSSKEEGIECIGVSEQRLRGGIHHYGEHVALPRTQAR